MFISAQHGAQQIAVKSAVFIYGSVAIRLHFCIYDANVMIMPCRHVSECFSYSGSYVVLVRFNAEYFVSVYLLSIHINSSRPLGLDCLFFITSHFDSVIIIVMCLFRAE